MDEVSKRALAYVFYCEHKITQEIIGRYFNVVQSTISDWVKIVYNALNKNKIVRRRQRNTIKQIPEPYLKGAIKAGNSDQSMGNSSLSGNSSEETDYYYTEEINPEFTLYNSLLPQARVHAKNIIDAGLLR